MPLPHGPSPSRPTGRSGSPSVGLNGSPSVGLDGSPSIGLDGSPSVGLNGSPSVGLNGSPSKLPSRLAAIGLPATAALALVGAGLALVACRPQPSTQTPAAAAPAGETTQGDAAAPEPKAAASSPAVDLSAMAFDDMSHPQKVMYMKQVVTPQMAAHFQAHDAQRYAQFDCSTCHGPGAKEGNFEMPTPALPRLGDFEQAKAEHPKDMAFMMEVVTPQMAKLLKEEPFDPKTQKGFGCFGCHMPAQAAG